MSWSGSIKHPRLVLAAVLACVTGLAAWRLAPAPAPEAARTDLPDRLSDAEFWRLSSAMSEPGGTFHSDNFVSNEAGFERVIPELVRRARGNGFYVGVGPEQNFTYIAALRPHMAFIVDIRRGNLQEHLLYKALLEMSSDRVEFLARLFSRQPPEGLSAASPIEQIFSALESEPASEARYQQNLAAVLDWLTTTHAWRLDADDRDGIAYIYRNAFFSDGPDLNYRLTGQSGGGTGTPTYGDLMAADDGSGRQWSYLASEDNFASLKRLEAANLLVPVVGDFGGPKALRAVGKYARDHGATISAFYVSNVEQYLEPDAKWNAFCSNVRSMPLDDSSTFIRSVRGGGGPRRAGPMFASSLAAIESDTRRCATGGRE
jgi:hypothetical protein